MRHTGTTELIRNAMKDAGTPLSIDEVCDLLPEGTDRRGVVSLVQERKRVGEIQVEVVDGKARYSLVPGFVSPRKLAHAKKPTFPKRNFVAAAEAGKLRSAMEFSYGTACDAVEMYLASVVDQKVYGPLIAARDQARQALDALIAGGS